MDFRLYFYCFLICLYNFIKIIGDLFLILCCVFLILVNPEQLKRFREDNNWKTDESLEQIEKEGGTLDFGNMMVCSELFLNMKVIELVDQENGIKCLYLQLLKTDSLLAKQFRNYLDEDFELIPHLRAPLIAFVDDLPNLGKFLDQTFDRLSKMNR